MPNIDYVNDKPNILKTLSKIMPALMMLLCTPTPYVVMLFVGFDLIGLLLGVLCAFVVLAAVIMLQLVLIHWEHHAYWLPAMRARYPNFTDNNRGFWPWQW